MTYGVLLEVAYDGTEFHGWAAQSGVRTVEDTLRGAVLALDPAFTVLARDLKNGATTNER